MNIRGALCAVNPRSMLTTLRRLGTAVTGWLKAIFKPFASRVTPGRRLREGEVELVTRIRVNPATKSFQVYYCDVRFEDLSARSQSDADTLALAACIDAQAVTSVAIIKKLESATSLRVYRTFVDTVKRQYFDTQPVTEPGLKQSDTQGGVIP